ncbi:MAG: MFS transporter [Betaproteobacteria bacterium]|nr:MFS transporter [Betaproteobacteria bacterium]
MSQAPSTPVQSRLEFGFMVAALTIGQGCGTLLTVAMPTIAPAVAESYGVPVYMIGYQVSLVYLGVMTGLVFGANLSTRWGACRTTQAGLALQAIGILLASTRQIVLLAPASAFLGLGYALLTPASSHLLLRFTPEHRRNLVFSIKQTGVPLGALGAALTAAGLTLLFGWQGALWTYAVLVLGVVAAMQWRRERWDDDRYPNVPLAAKPLAAVGVMWRIPALRRLSIVGGLLICGQMCMQNFTVVMLFEELKMPLVQAGLILSIAQVGGVSGRLFWGWMADRSRDCIQVMMLLAGILLCVALATATLGPGWPLSAIAVLFFLFGATASGWHGAYLSEAARLSPPGQVSMATSGSLLLNNTAAMVTPLIFAGIYTGIHSYAYTFGVLGLPALASMLLLWGARHATTGARSATP